MELASLGVRVNCICPGVVDTEMIRNNQKLFDALQTITPMGHMAQADQLADAMFFLLGPQSAYITGVDLAVDGGLTSGGIFSASGKSHGCFVGLQFEFWKCKTQPEPDVLLLWIGVSNVVQSKQKGDRYESFEISRWISAGTRLGIRLPGERSADSQNRRDQSLQWPLGLVWH
jgi:hypothetical protein